MIIYKNQSPWGSPPPGGNGNGGYRRGPTPPDIEEIIKNIKKKLINLCQEKVEVVNLLF